VNYLQWKICLTGGSQKIQTTFITTLKMFLNRKDLREENPWVRVDKETWQILQVGTFEFINKSKVEGHTMTLAIYEQILEDRYDRNTIEQIKIGRMANQI
jgi:hypothetical protein